MDSLCLYSIQRKKVLFSSRVPFIILSLFVIFLFTNNHSALFISDYFILPVLFSLFALLTIVRTGKFVLDYFSIGFIFVFVIGVFLSLIHFTEIDRGTMLSYFVWLIVLITVPSVKPDTKSIGYLLNGFILGALVCSLIFIFFHVEYGDTGRLTIRFLNNEEIDPNYLGCFLCIGFSFCLLYIMKTIRKRAFLLLYILSSIIILYAIFLSGSRAAYLFALLSFAGFLLELSKKLNSSKKFFLYATILIFAVAGGIIVIKVLPSNLLRRFGASSLHDISNTRRLEHWLFGFKAFSLSPMGYGFIHTKDILTTYVNHASDCHNTFITFLLHFGVFGFATIVYVLFRILKPIFKSKSPFWIFFIIAFLLNGVIISNHLGVPFWMPLIVLYYFRDKTIRNQFVNFKWLP